MKHIGIIMSILFFLILTGCMSKNTQDTPEAQISSDTSMMEKEVMGVDESASQWSESEMKAMEMEKNAAMMDTMDKTDDTMEKDETMMKDDTMKVNEAMMDKKEAISSQSKAGVYTSYDTKLLGNSENTVIFFHAAWCPSCRAADAGISAGVIPSGLTILKADYDSETSLKKKYGVTAQHTFVLVDAQGEMIKKWAGGTNIESIVEKL